jgi:HEAT repeat protein
MNLSNSLFGLAVASLLLLSGCSKGGGEVANLATLRQQLKAPETEAKQNACTDLAQLGSGAKGALPDLLPLLHDPDPLTRRLAAYAVGQIGRDAKSALPELKKLLADPDLAVTTTAVNAINNIDPKEAGDVKLVNTQSQ